MADKKAEPLEWVFFFSGVGAGTIFFLVAAILFLPKGVIPFALAGASGAVLGGFAGQFLYKALQR